MKYYYCLLIAIIGLSTNAYAFQPKIEIIEQFDELSMIAFITKEDINANPEWSPELGAPPLTVVEAIQAVKKIDKTSNAIKEIEIRTVPNHEKHWHYLIKISNDEMKTKYNVYIVLMSGKVIPAIIEPQGYK